jgi:hypothetical protein
MDFSKAEFIVVSKPNLEKFSIVYFVHPRYEDRLDPLDYCIDITGCVRKFPFICIAL